MRAPLPARKRSFRDSATEFGADAGKELLHPSRNGPALNDPGHEQAQLDTEAECDSIKPATEPLGGARDLSEVVQGSAGTASISIDSIHGLRPRSSADAATIRGSTSVS